MMDIVELMRAGRVCDDKCRVMEARSGCLCAEAADTITALRAENERLKVDNIQMQAALGYGILAEDERHILPSNPFKCGTCDASNHLLAENERLRAALREIASGKYSGIVLTSYPPQDPAVNRARAALEEKQ